MNLFTDLKCDHCLVDVCTRCKITRCNFCKKIDQLNKKSKLTNFSVLGVFSAHLMCCSNLSDQT